MSDPIHVIAAIDDETGDEALYVGGVLKAECHTLYMDVVAKVTKGLVIEFSQVCVGLPEDQNYPDKFEDLMQFISAE